MAKRGVKGRKPVKLHIDNEQPLGTAQTSLAQLAQGGQDAEKHNYPARPQKRVQGVFAVNSYMGKGSANKGKPKRGVVGKS
jgi:hypothetical protein